MHFSRHKIRVNTDDNASASRKPKHYIYIYIAYALKLESGFVVLGQEKEQGRFRRSTGEHRGSNEAQSACRGGTTKEERFGLLKELILAGP